GGGNENELEANLDGNVGGDGNENEVEDNLDENVGGDGNENEIQNIWLNSVSLEKVNVITEENLESNLVNSKKRDDYDVYMGKSMDEGKETNLDGVLKEGDNDISKRDKESTFSQILTKIKNKKQQTMGNTSIIIGGYEQVTHGPQKDVEMDELSRVVDIAVADTLEEKSMTVGRKESPVTRSMDAQLEKAARKNKPKSVGDKEKQICTVATVQEGRVSDIKPINAVPIRYAELKKDGIYEEKEKWVRELSEALCSPYVKRNVSVTNELQAVEKPVVESIFTERYPVRDIIFKTNNLEIQRVTFESMHEGFLVTEAVIDLSWKFEEFKRKFEEAMTYTNQTNIENFDLVFFPIIQAGSKANHFYLIVYNLKTLEVDIIDNKKEESQDIVRRYGEIPKRLVRFKKLVFN
ncbi:ulp1 protease family, C-terminal catalytic domain-containing protein, partial [Tanacetum coccineum]